MKLRYRTVWISDTHLGSRGAQARDLMRFLRCIECEKLYLVGDIIDLWRLKSRWYWPDEHNQVVRYILGLVKDGVKVIYVPGNHDEAAREYLGVEIGGVTVLPQDVHRTITGRRLLVTHGDQYDLVVKHSRLTALAGAAAYEWLIRINRIYNIIRRWRGLPYWSLSKYLKERVKSACTFISRFEDALVRETRSRELQGVVCGHIHKAEYRIEADGEIEYYNCGDWVESCTAVVEHIDGSMEVIEALPRIAELVKHSRRLAAGTQAGEAGTAAESSTPDSPSLSDPAQDPAIA